MVFLLSSFFFYFNDCFASIVSVLMLSIALISAWYISFYLCAFVLWCLPDSLRFHPFGYDLFRSSLGVIFAVSGWLFCVYKSGPNLRNTLLEDLSSLDLTC